MILGARLNPAPEWLWNGDQISVIHLPIYCQPSGLPYRVSGYGSYRGSKWFLDRTDHIDNNDDDFYKKAPEGYLDDKEGDEAFFYCKPGRGDVPEEDCGTGDFWVHLDPFGNISFYTNRCSAHGCKSDRIELASLGTSSLARLRRSTIGMASGVAMGQHLAKTSETIIRSLMCRMKTQTPAFVSQPPDSNSRLRAMTNMATPMFRTVARAASLAGR